MQECKVRWRTKIFDLAAERGWSDTVLARHLGVNQTTVWRQRSGKRAPSVKLMYAAAAVFHQPPHVLWWQEQPREPKTASEAPAEPERAPVAL